MYLPTLLCPMRWATTETVLPSTILGYLAIESSIESYMAWSSARYLVLYLAVIPVVRENTVEC